ncbi:AraC family transcriptional regulator [Streptomyces sp. RFCAC02]|uniref:helix-turn-helix transcriptional regulator n=1 Tax=Streptomyces sp. RFCAC02 TaxID=2499143 RepID=UPI001F1146B2|nr:AraC family transcriptional regulator [Streptomyces sp. RFCAC02]
MSLTGHPRTNPVRCEEFGYGLGRPDGIFVLRYRAADMLEFDDRRQDFLHQLYFSPAGILTLLHGPRVRFTGAGEAFWAERAVAHEVRAGDGGAVYRVCLRQVPPALTGLGAGVVSIDPEAARLLTTVIARTGCPESEALAARERFMAGLAPSADAYVAHHATGSGLAAVVARELARDPGDATELREWAGRLHVSVKTLQRDFVREFGVSFSRWRTVLRMRAARALLGDRPVTRVAHLVGYASASAFVAAFTREYGYTPGRHHTRAERARRTGPGAAGTP